MVVSRLYQQDVLELPSRSHSTSYAKFFSPQGPLPSLAAKVAQAPAQTSFYVHELVPFALLCSDDDCAFAC